MTRATSHRAVSPSRLNVTAGFITIPRVLLAVAIAIWLVGLPLLSTAPTSNYGLLFAAGPSLAIAAGLAILAFAVSIRIGNLTDAVLSMVTYITIVRLPVALLTTVPIYSWTYKHLGVVDYISATGSVPTGVDIYSGWPGFFAFMAWFDQTTGISALDTARWFSYGYHLLLAVAIYGLSRAFGYSAKVALVAVFISESVNWVAQDYFSPQAFGYLLAIVFLALLLHSRHRRSIGWLTIPLFVAITVSHQLTPIWLVGIALVLGMTGHVRPRYLGIILGAIAGIYIMLNFDALQGHSLVSDLNPLANAQSNDIGNGSPGETLTAQSARVTAIALWSCSLLVIAFGLFRNRSFRSPAFTAAVLGFSSFALLLGQNYGGEAIYRVFLYSIPGCSLALAPFIARALSSNRIRSLAVAVAALAVGLSSLQAYYGGWFTNLVRPDSYAASLQMYAKNSPPAFFLAPAPGGVARATGKYVDFAEYDKHFDTALTTWPGWIGEPFTNSTKLNSLTKDLEWSGVPVTMFVTKQMVDYSDYFGLYPRGALPRLVQQLREDARWVTVTDTPTLHVFTLDETHD